MKTQAAIPFADTNIIPDRNAGIGSLLWDLQNPQDPDRDGAPLLNREFAFIDVGVSRAKVSTALKTLLASDLGMNVEYAATERPEAVPYANITRLGDPGEKIRQCLSKMISSKETAREVMDWHFVVDRTGKVASVAYSYRLHGNEVWEAYFMGRPFMVSGQTVDFFDPTLDEMLAPETPKIESIIELDRKRNGDPSQADPSWNGYKIERSPLETDLAELGITLQNTDVPQRVRDRQNVLFLGNVLNSFPRDQRTVELERIAANMEEGDIVIVQLDEVETSSIEVLQVNKQGAQKTLERVRWINTRTLEVQQSVRRSRSWRQIRVKPEVDRMVSRLIESLRKQVPATEWNEKNNAILVHRYVSHVFGTFFRALPVERTLRIAARKALQRLQTEGGALGAKLNRKDDES